MNPQDRWETIIDIELLPNQKVQRNGGWIKLDEPFPEYRLTTGSSHLDQHIDIFEDDIKNKSEMKARRFSLLNHYDAPIQVKMQKRVKD
jgi:hypothetical protein